MTLIDKNGDEYPEEAYAENGRTGEKRLWWKLEVTPGKPKAKFGAERKLAAWMSFNVNEGDTFTIADLRRALGDQSGDVIDWNTDEHLNRRFRALRPDGWEVPSNKDDRSLPVGTYRLVEKGWSPEDGERPPRTTVSQGMARKILARDGHRCKLCGVGSGEPYPDGSGLAVIGVGHIKSQAARGSSKDEANLRAECKRCNEPVRDKMRVPETAAEITPDVRSLKKDELLRLRTSLEQGFLARDRMTDVYDRIRVMRLDDQEAVLEKVRSILGD